MNFRDRAYILLFSSLLISLLFSSDHVFAQQNDSKKAWIKVIADLEQYYVVIDNDYENPHLINRGDSVQVEPGERQVTVVWKTIHDHSFNFNAKAGETIGGRILNTFPTNPRTSYQTIVNQRNLQIISDPKSIIYINGERAGEHIVNTILKPGTHQLRIIHPEYGTLRKAVDVNSHAVTEIARFNENPSKLPFAAKLLPGAEYIASKRYKRASITYLSLGVLAANLVRQDISYNEKLSDYNEWEVLYENAQTTMDAIEYRESAQSARDNLEEISKNFNLTLIITAGVYLASTLDALRKPKSGYKHKLPFSSSTKFSLLATSPNYKLSPGFTFKINFGK